MRRTSLGSEMEAEAVSVMTFNVRYDEESDGEDRWARRRGDVISFLKEKRPVVLGVQEALVHQRDDLATAFPGYGVVGGGRDDGDRGGELNCIFYLHEELHCVASGTFWLSSTPHQPGTKVATSSLPRICTWAMVHRHGSPKSMFVVFNTHLDHQSSEARRQQTSILLRQIQHIAGLYPSVLMGDLNCTSSSPPYEALASSFYMDSRGIAEESSVINGHLKSFTGFHSPTSVVPPGSTQIDHVFVSGFDVLRWEQTSQLRPNGRALSDHRALLVHLVNQYE